MIWFLLPIPHLTLMSFCTQGLPGVAESTVSKSDNLLPGEKVPVSERMRSGGKCSSQALTHHLRRSPPLTEGKDYLLDDGFCDFAFGSAQNDNIAGGVQVSYLNEGRVQSCSCGADSTRLTLPNGTPQANRG